MTSDNFHFYLQNRRIQTSQTGGQRYSDTSPLKCSLDGVSIYRPGYSGKTLFCNQEEGRRYDPKKWKSESAYQEMLRFLAKKVLKTDNKLIRCYGFLINGMAFATIAAI